MGQKKAVALAMPIAMLADRPGRFYELRWDEGTDVFSIELGAPDGAVAQRFPAGPNVLVGFNAKGVPVSVEMRDASKSWPRAQLALLRGRELRLAEAARRIGRSPSTLRNQVANGKLKARKDGRDLFVLERDLERYLAELSPRGRPAGQAAGRRPRRGAGGESRRRGRRG